MFDLKIVESTISLDELKALAKTGYGDMIKGVIDIQKEIFALGPELHVDAEQVLLGDSSQQIDLWGFNIYPEEDRANWIEFDSMINIRPNHNNRSRYVEDENIRNKITELINKKIK